MISITTNLQSMLVRSNLSNATNGINTTIERMTTGFKLNRAKDNAAGYSIADTMSSKISSYQVAEDNVSMGLDMITTASETLELINGKLSRLRELAIQASNGTYSTESRAAILAESSSIVDEINRVYKNAEYNGQKLFDDQMTVEAPATMPQAGADGFIEAITKRDTTTMTTLASVNPNTDLADDTYSISTPEELKKLADMTNAGLVSAGDEFVLANDIDLSCYENWTPIGSTASSIYFLGKFDGNGYKIKNLTTNSFDQNSTALFGVCLYATIENIGIENANINGIFAVAGLIGKASRSTVFNCYVKNSNITQNAHKQGISSATGYPNSHAAGLIADAPLSNISYCYTDAYITGASAGGIVGFSDRGSVENCFTTSKINALDLAGGIVFTESNNAGRTLFKNCYVLTDSKLTGVFAGSMLNKPNRTCEIQDCYYNSYYDEIGTPLIGNDTGSSIIGTVTSLGYTRNNLNTNLQVGIHGDNNSKIQAAFELKLNVGCLKMVGADISSCVIKHIDEQIKLVSSKQTELGAVQNRLESVQKGINTNIMNLTSSLSTIRDADISEEGTEYIQQQILQNACATLLSTANQTPSIALSLI